MKIRVLNFAMACAVAGLALAVSPAAPRAEEEASEAQAAQGEVQSQSGEGRGRGSRRRERVATGVARFNESAAKVTISYPKYGTDGADFKEIDGLKPGENIRFFKAQAIKMKTETNLTFGDKTIKTGNVSPNFAGVYSLWVTRTADGWALAFNNDADIWGTMREAAKDAEQVPLTHGKAEKPVENLNLTIEKKGDGAELKIEWGEHVWTTAFTPAK